MAKLAKSGEEILALPIKLVGEREEHRLAAGGQELATIREYLCEVLALMWRDGATGTLQHHFGHDWQEPIYAALVRAEVVNGGEHLKEDGSLNSLWYWATYVVDADEYVARALASLAGQS